MRWEIWVISHHFGLVIFCLKYRKMQPEIARLRQRRIKWAIWLSSRPASHPPGREVLRAPAKDHDQHRLYEREI